MQHGLRIVETKIALEVAGIPVRSRRMKRGHVIVARHQPLLRPRRQLIRIVLRITLRPARPNFWSAEQQDQQRGSIPAVPRLLISLLESASPAFAGVSPVDA
jgi:hypothetical protein